MMRVLVTLLVGLALVGCGDERPRGGHAFIPDTVALTAEDGAVAVELGGTLVGGRLHYGKGRNEGREAARRDIGRRRPHWIGFGNIAWHHSGVNTRNGLPGVCGWDGRSHKTFEFFLGYNEEITAALKRGDIKPPTQVDVRSNYFSLLALLAQGPAWPVVKDGRTALDGGGHLRLTAHPDDDAYAYASLENAGARAIRFALVTRPVHLHLPENGQELVLQELKVMRVFHRATGELLREFPHSERSLETMRKARAKKAAAPK